jgi:hypothetical protein
VIQFEGRRVTVELKDSAPGADTVHALGTLGCELDLGLVMVLEWTAGGYRTRITFK